MELPPLPGGDYSGFSLACLINMNAGYAN